MPGPTASDDRDQTSAGERWPARLVGGRLRAARAALGMTLDDVAGGAGLIVQLNAAMYLVTIAYVAFHVSVIWEAWTIMFGAGQTTAAPKAATKAETKAKVKTKR